MRSALRIMDKYCKEKQKMERIEKLNQGNIKELFYISLIKYYNIQACKPRKVIWNSGY